VNTVRNDLLREGEYQRLVKEGAASGTNLKSLASNSAREMGLPLPSFLSVPITIFNSVVKKLALRMDDKIALEIARELTNPAIAAEQIEAAMRTQRNRVLSPESTMKGASLVATRALGSEMSKRAEPVNNKLTPSSQNALTK
jgi:hypothetical protein